MSTPLVWYREDNFIICDVKEEWDEKLKNFMVENYIGCSSVHNLFECAKDDKFITEYRRLLDHIFLDRCCLVIIDEQTEQIIGAAILKLMTAEMRSWAMLRLVQDSGKLDIFLNLNRNLINEHRELDKKNDEACNNLMHMFDICVIGNYVVDVDSEAVDDNDDATAIADNVKDWTLNLLECVIEVTRNMKANLVTYVAMTGVIQAVCQSSKLEEFSRTLYLTYIDEGTRPFLKTNHIDELCVMLFGKYVEPIFPYDQMTIFGAEKDAEEARKEKEKKKLKVDKRAPLRS